MPDASPRLTPSLRRPRPATITFNGAEIGVLRMGSPALAPLVLVHGFSGDMMTWQLNMSALARRFHVIAIDLPGHGLSTGETSIAHWRLMAEWLGELLQALEVSRPHLVGHSLGGRLALALAESGAALRSVTAISCASVTPYYDYDFLVRMCRIASLEDARACSRQLFGGATIDHDRFARALHAKLSTPRAQANLKRFLEHNFPGGKVRQVPPIAWAEIRTPIQFIWGRDDTVNPPPPEGWLPKTVPCHLLDRVGHMPHVAAADKVNHLIAEFAAQAPGA